MADNTIRSVPFLGHLSSEEILYLEQHGDVLRFGSNQSVDLKSMKSLCIVVSGMFEIESPGNADIVYLSRGSSFGAIPFCDYKRRGRVRALVDSEIIMLREEVLFRLFLKSYRAMRGFVRILDRSGFPLSSTGKSYLASKSKVVACVSDEAGAGKSLGTSLLGLKFSQSERTIILDTAYEGKSIFQFFEKDQPLPISQRPEDLEVGEKFIRDRIVEVDDNLSILNICHDSLVAVDPEIFNISRDYSIVLVDVTSRDRVMREHVLNRSDYVINFIKKDFRVNQSSFLDRELSEGQRVLNIRNDFFVKSSAAFSGGYILEANRDYSNLSSFDNLKIFSQGSFCSDVEKIMLSPKRAFVFESAQHESIFYTGFLSLLAESGIEFDWLYSSSYSFILIALMLLLETKDLKNEFSRFFSTNFVRKMVRASFPDKYLYGISKFTKYAREISGGKRVEMFRSIGMCKLCDNGYEKIFSSGDFSVLMSASFSLAPLFQSVNIGGRSFASGYPASQALPLECFRTIADEIISLELGNRRDLVIEGINYPEIFKNVLSQNNLVFHKKDNLYSDRKFILEVSEKEFNFDRIFFSSQKSSEVILVNINSREKS